MPVILILTLILITPDRKPAEPTTLVVQSVSMEQCIDDANRWADKSNDVAQFVASCQSLH